MMQLPDDLKFHTAKLCPLVSLQALQQIEQFNHLVTPLIQERSRKIRIYRDMLVLMQPGESIKQTAFRLERERPFIDEPFAFYVATGDFAGLVGKKPKDLDGLTWDLLQTHLMIIDRQRAISPIPEMYETILSFMHEGQSVQDAMGQNPEPEYVGAMEQLGALMGCDMGMIAVMTRSQVQTHFDVLSSVC